MTRRISFKNIRLLTKVQTCNLFGGNEFRHTKDKKRRSRWIAMAATVCFLVVVLIFYVAALCVGLTVLGMANLIPEYLFTITSLVIFFFTMLKAGSVIFQKKGYDILMSLPVSAADITISRFLTMYVSNLLISALVMLPGIVIYGIASRPPLLSYLFAVLGTVLLPLLPITLATVFGAGVTAISSRMRHKSIVSALLTIVIAIGLIAVSSVFGGSVENFTEKMLQNFAETVSSQLRHLYYPAAWFGNAVVQGSALAFFLLLAVSAAVFAVTIFLVQHYFRQICTALFSTSAKNDYKAEHLRASSVTAAMFRREMKHYFSSSIYVSNTLIGYILMAAASVALAVIGPERLFHLLDGNGDMDFAKLIPRILPFFLSLLATIMPTTACSISMEGKHWWILETLPVKSCDVWNGKILVNLTLVGPAYLLSVICCLLAVKPTLPEAIWMILIPALYILFSSVAGITVNIALPLMDWDNEVRVVKQSASVAVTMLVDFISIAIPVILLLALPLSYHIIAGIWCAVLAASTALLYRLNGKKQLTQISA